MTGRRKSGETQSEKVGTHRLEAVSLLGRRHSFILAIMAADMATTGFGFGTMIQGNAMAHVHTTIKTLATSVLQNSTQIVKEEERCFFPFHSSPFLNCFVFSHGT